MEKRKYLRIPMQAPVSGAIEYKAEMQDISINGCFVRTSLELVKGTVINLEFTLPNTPRIIRTRAEVRWYGNYSSDRRIDTSFGVGLKFTEISLDDIGIISEFVKERATQTRKHPRAVISFPVAYDRDDDKNLRHVAQALDISLGGVFVKTKQFFDLDDIIHMEFSLPDSKKAIRCTGKIVSISDEIPKIFNGLIEHGMGVEFRSIDDNDLEAIDAYLKKYFSQSTDDN